MMRLNKFIAHYSTYSRREADQAILGGYVRIDGEIEKNPAVSVDERSANVSVSGHKITATDQFTVIVYNKPRGELVTKKDPQNRKTIYDSLSSNYKHFIPCFFTCDFQFNQSGVHLQQLFIHKYILSRKLFLCVTNSNESLEYYSL